MFRLWQEEYSKRLWRQTERTKGAGWGTAKAANVITCTHDVKEMNTHCSRSLAIKTASSLSACKASRIRPPTISQQCRHVAMGFNTYSKDYCYIKAWCQCLNDRWGRHHNKLSIQTRRVSRWVHGRRWARRRQAGRKWFVSYSSHSAGCEPNMNWWAAASI